MKFATQTGLPNAYFQCNMCLRSLQLQATTKPGYQGEAHHMSEKIAVVGLGYVGLPVAIALARKFEHTTGFDISGKRIEALKSGYDQNSEVDDTTLKATKLKFTNKADDLIGCNFFIVTVPTPINSQNRPDLTPLSVACELIGPRLTADAVVVFESTVYPGVTEDYCAPLLEKFSGLKCGSDFKLGYSPERINPGDKVHSLENVIKVISADDDSTMARLRSVYGAIVPAGLFEAASIRVAETAKVLENTQRDLNIALMNEVAIILDRMNIRTQDVLAAAATKWNFLKFSPGLVGGHCIGVDPYYLTASAEEMGYRPDVILAGRRVNNNMSTFIADKTAKLMMRQGLSSKTAKVGFLGLTYKENVPDFRNSKALEIISELQSYGLRVLATDPHLAVSDALLTRRGIEELDLAGTDELDAIILAVPHNIYVKNISALQGKLKINGVFIDVRSSVPHAMRRTDVVYWSL